MKKILALVLVLFTSLLLVSCQTEEYVVFYDTNGGNEEILPERVEEGNYVTRPTTILTKEGYEFLYWYDVAKEETEYPFEITKVVSDLFLTAKWEENNPGDVNKYIVTFNSNKGTDVPYQSIDEGLKATKPTDPTLLNNIFKGWYTEETLINLYDFNSPISSNLTLYAKWEDVSVPLKEYTIRFNSNGGTVVPNSIVKEGSKVLVPNVPTYSGHIFKGWYKEALLLNLYDFNTLVSSDLTLYAKWEVEVPLVEYSVSFNSMGGSSIANVLVKEGNKVGSPNSPIYSGFIFKGWYTEEELINRYDFNNKVSNDFTLYAKWEERTPGDLLDYYHGYDLESTTGAVFRENLKTRLFKGTKIKSYGGHLNPILVDSDKHPTVEGHVYTIYDGESIKNNFTSGSGNADYKNVWNKEHVMPKSWYTSAHVGDLHNLRACRESINSIRGNLKFAPGSGEQGRVTGGFYPGDDHKGDSARIAMYMMVMLPKDLNPNNVMAGENPVETLINWHLEDPVDEFEIRRNNIIHEAQGNRNPFIDHPEFADLIWGASVNNNLIATSKLMNLITSTNVLVDILSSNNEVYIPSRKYII